mgnify:CR=1 FL=1
MKKTAKENLRALIRGAGLRATAPRVAVLNLLMNSKRPLSCTEVTEVLGQDDWDQATLYRNLVTLVDSKLARVASRVGGISRYQFRTANEGSHSHAHFACRDCGDVECVPPKVLEALNDAKWREAFSDVELEITGKCKKCRSRRK